MYGGLHGKQGRNFEDKSDMTFPELSAFSDLTTHPKQSHCGEAKAFRLFFLIAQ